MYSETFILSLFVSAAMAVTVSESTMYSGQCAGVVDCLMGVEQFISSTCQPMENTWMNATCICYANVARSFCLNQCPDNPEAQKVAIAFQSEVNASCSAVNLDPNALPPAPWITDDQSATTSTESSLTTSDSTWNSSSNITSSGSQETEVTGSDTTATETISDYSSGFSSLETLKTESGSSDGTTSETSVTGSETMATETTSDYMADFNSLETSIIDTDTLAENATSDVTTSIATSDVTTSITTSDTAVTESDATATESDATDTTTDTSTTNIDDVYVDSGKSFSSVPAILGMLVAAILF